MGTRAIYTFKDKHETFHVYKHWDNYPTGAAKCIEKAKSKAWALPRYEASDFAAAFIAANKEEGGDVRMSDGNIGWEEYIYEITMKDSELHVVARPVGNEQALDPIYDGPQSGFAAWAEEYERSDD